ncbi:MAG: prepilin peptidase [Dictyoglomaceae bacterium]|nr:prepilin peptidase [Dictyoglomaceae bacterium]
MTLIKLLFLIWMFFLGASIGSFLNVLIYRLPRGESVIFPPSHCPKCNRRLGIWDLIPVISYIILRGKCRYCGESISIRYLLVEILLGMIFSILFFFFDFSFFTFKSLIFISFLMPIFFIDLEHMLIPDVISISGTLIGIILAFFEGKLVESLKGSIIVGIILLLIYVFALIFYKKEGMGQGDIKLGLLLGSFLGIKLGLLTLFLGFILGGIFSIILIIFKRKNLKEYLPFGPFLIISGILSYFWGENLINFYLALF